jgi:hypothetical protein
MRSDIYNLFTLFISPLKSETLNIPSIIVTIMTEYIPMFPRPDPAKAIQSKNLIFKDEETFEKALDEIFEENREGFILLGRS